MPTDFNLDDAIRKVKDFPVPGILYYDITSILLNPVAFAWCIDEMARRCAKLNINKIAALESRGFLFAAPLAVKLNLPLVMVRKAGKLPGKTISEKYALEYDIAEMEIQISDVDSQDNILIIDDLIATGGTIEATISLLKRQGAHIEEIMGVVGLPALKYQEKLAGYRIQTLINYLHE